MTEVCRTAMRAEQSSPLLQDIQDLGYHLPQETRWQGALHTPYLTWDGREEASRWPQPLSVADPVGPQSTARTAPVWAERRCVQMPKEEIRYGEMVSRPYTNALGGSKKGDRKGACKTQEPTEKKTKLKKQKEIPYNRFSL